MLRSRLLICLLVAAAALAVPGAAQTAHVDLSLGYQWVTVDGNHDMYRSQVDQEDGFVLRSFSLLLVDDGKGEPLFDRLRIDASDLSSATPQSSLRLHAVRAGAVDLRLTYRRAQAYSALPRFANPFVWSEDPYGTSDTVDSDSPLIIPGEHTMDRKMETLDLDVQILPGKTVTPIVGYTRYRFDGPGTTTFSVGGDDFRMSSDLDEKSDEFRAGLALHLGTFQATVVQGWRNTSSHHLVELLPGAGDGNLGRSLLGKDYTLEAYSRSSYANTDVPITRGTFSGRIGDRITVAGSFMNGEMEMDGAERENFHGDLVTFRFNRFFTGFSGSTSYSAENSPFWRGNARVQANLAAGLDLTVGYSARHRELDGMALVDEFYNGITTFTGISRDDITRVIDVANAFERDEESVEARVDWRRGDFRAWAGWTGIDEDLTVSPDAAEIVLPWGQGGTFDRSTDRTNVGVGYRHAGFEASADFWRDEADTAVMRTDVTDRDRWRVRVGWGDGHLVRVLGTVESIDSENTLPDGGFHLDSDRYGFDIEVTPTDALSLRGSYALFKTDTSIPIVKPETLGFVDSLYSEDGDTIEAALMWNTDRFDLDAGYSWFDSSGSLPLTLDHGWLRYSMGLSGDFGAAVEFDYFDYTEDAFSLADFTAKRYGLFLTWRR